MRRTNVYTWRFSKGLGLNLFCFVNEMSEIPAVPKTGGMTNHVLQLLQFYRTAKMKTNSKEKTWKQIELNEMRTLNLWKQIFLTVSEAYKSFLGTECQVS